MIKMYYRDNKGVETKWYEGYFRREVQRPSQYVTVWPHDSNYDGAGWYFEMTEEEATMILLKYA